MRRLLGISGSLRRASYNSALLRAAAAACDPDVKFERYGGLDAIPAYSEDFEHVPPPARLLEQKLAAADAVLFATPEYNASVPGALKNALDWVSRPFETNPLRDKPVAVVGASQGIFGAVWAQEELRKILRTLGARVGEHQLALARAQHAFTQDGRLRDPRQAAALTAIIESLLRETQRRAA